VKSAWVYKHGIMVRSGGIAVGGVECCECEEPSSSAPSSSSGGSSSSAGSSFPASSGRRSSSSASSSSTLNNTTCPCCDSSDLADEMLLNLGAGGWTNLYCDNCTGVKGNFFLPLCPNDEPAYGSRCGWQFTYLNWGGYSGGGSYANLYIKLLLLCGATQFQWKVILSLDGKSGTPPTPGPPDPLPNCYYWGTNPYSAAVWLSELVPNGSLCLTPGEPLTLTKFGSDTHKGVGLEGGSKLCQDSLPNTITLRRAG